MILRPSNHDITLAASASGARTGIRHDVTNITEVLKAETGGTFFELVSRTGHRNPNAAMRTLVRYSRVAPGGTPGGMLTAASAGGGVRG
jgi:hypothetical protein